jgi:hypothetical protein
MSMLLKGIHPWFPLCPHLAQPARLSQLLAHPAITTGTTAQMKRVNYNNHTCPVSDFVMVDPEEAPLPSPYPAFAHVVASVVSYVCTRASRSHLIYHLASSGAFQQPVIQQLRTPAAVLSCGLWGRVSMHAGEAALGLLECSKCALVGSSSYKVFIHCGHFTM